MSASLVVVVANRRDSAVPEREIGKVQMGDTNGLRTKVVSRGWKNTMKWPF
jgi:hypothetical protein